MNDTPRRSALVPQLERGHYVVACIAVPMLLAAPAVSILRGNWEFLYYSAWLMIFALGVLVLDARVRLPFAVYWGLTLWCLAHLAGGIMPIPESLTEPGRPPNLYNMRVAPWMPKYDQIVHCLGFLVATLCAWCGLRSRIVGAVVESGVSPSDKPAARRATTRVGFGLFLAVVLMGMGLGAMNEVMEFVATRIMPWTNVGGYENTGWDLVSNPVGCLIAACLAATHPRWLEPRGLRSRGVGSREAALREVTPPSSAP